MSTEMCAKRKLHICIIDISFYHQVHGKGKKGGGAEESSGASWCLYTQQKGVTHEDEDKMRTLKWIFATPRSEFVEQLKEQMQPCECHPLHTALPQCVLL